MLIRCHSCLFLISAVCFSFILCLILEKVEITMEKQPQRHIYKINEVIISGIHWNLRPCLYGVKMSQVERSPAIPSYLGQANISLQNLVSHLHEKQKIGLVTLL